MGENERTETENALEMKEARSVKKKIVFNGRVFYVTATRGKKKVDWKFVT